jgi:hypothetical protein
MANVPFDEYIEGKDPLPSSIGGEDKIPVVRDGIVYTTDLQTELAAKANLASPTFTGTVAGVSKSMVGLGNVDNTSDATKNSASATLTNKSISGSSNTLTNIAQSSITSLTTDLALKAPLASPALTGNPTATTQTAGNNTTRVATTAFVTTAVSEVQTLVNTMKALPNNDYAIRVTDGVISFVATSTTETAELLLDSNGWSGVSISPATNTTDDNLDQYLVGGPFNTALWSTESYYKWWIFYITGNNNGSPITANYGGPSLTTVVGRSGANITALKLEITAKPPSTGVPQIRLTDYQDPGDTGDGRTEPVFYQRMWIKFDPEIAIRAAREGGDFYHIFWEPKCEPDYRMRVQLEWNGSKLVWVAHDDVLTNSTHIHDGTNSSVDVVLASASSSDGWHKFEVYVDRPNGVWRAAIDGSNIINLNFGAGTDLYGASGNVMNFPMFVQLYSTPSLPFVGGDGPMYMLVEDIELWDSPPLDAWS